MRSVYSAGTDKAAGNNQKYKSDLQYLNISAYD